MKVEVVVSSSLSITVNDNHGQAVGTFTYSFMPVHLFNCWT